MEDGLAPLISSGHVHAAELHALRADLERAWSAETSFWPEEWSPGLASLGQCAVTALVVHDRFGGEILRTVNEGVLHYWNRIDGDEVDLTRDQFEVWAPEDATVAVDATQVAASGPTLAARTRLLSQALDGRDPDGSESGAWDELPPPPDAAVQGATANRPSWLRTLTVLTLVFGLPVAALALWGWLALFQSGCAFPWGTAGGCADEVGFTSRQGLEINNAHKGGWQDTVIGFELHGSPEDVDAALAAAGIGALHPLDDGEAGFTQIDVDLSELTEPVVGHDTWTDRNGTDVDREVLRARSTSDPSRAVVYVLASR